MNAVVDFLRAALPWIAVGLLLAVFFARNAGKKKGEEPTGDYGTEGMCWGMCLGTAIGTSLGNHTGLGISLGMLIGLAIGTCIKKESHGEDNNETEQGERGRGQSTPGSEEVFPRSSPMADCGMSKMKRNAKVVIGCSIVAAICFGIVSYGHFYRGRVELGWLFAILTIAQSALAVTNYIISKKTN